MLSPASAGRALKAFSLLHFAYPQGTREMRRDRGRKLRKARTPRGAYRGEENEPTQ